MGYTRGFRMVPLDSTGNFLLVINCTRGRILHRFRDITFDMSSVAIIWLPLLLFTLVGGVPLGRSS